MGFVDLVRDCIDHLDSRSRTCCVGVFLFYLLSACIGLPAAFCRVGEHVIHHALRSVQSSSSSSSSPASYLFLSSPSSSYVTYEAYSFKVTALVVIVLSETMRRAYAHDVNGCLWQDLGFGVMNNGSVETTPFHRVYKSLFVILYKWAYTYLEKKTRSGIVSSTLVSAAPASMTHFTPLGSSPFVSS